MSSANGDRKPPRPRIEMVSPRDPGEAAAVIAAVERFIAETAPLPQADSIAANSWQRAALIEGIGAKQAFASPWGEPRTWGVRHSPREWA